MALKMQKPWWLTDTYDGETDGMAELEPHAGPNGVALVRLWPNGKTSEGWGLTGRDGGDGFMPRYLRDEFNPRRVLYGYSRDRWAFAFVMRSLNVIAIDIDGKNGGIQHAGELLGNAPVTLAETSKSGTGYHLFYRTDETWDTTTGFGEELADHIGIVQGVDIRSTGCVYHHKTQRWNGRQIAPLPQHIADRLRSKVIQKRTQSEAIVKTLELDETEVLMMQDELLTELAKPVDQGKRNVTLFAIGTKMKLAQVPDWQDHLATRGTQLGLPDPEIDKLVRNVETYGA